MNIHHEPIFDILKLEKLYSEKDGVDIKYVCTSATNLNATWAADIFYRETPHPEFGNRYFGLYWLRLHFEVPAQLMITDADAIEDLEFGMIEARHGWTYSQHRHDYRSIGGIATDDGRSVGSSAIDGGRAYVRRSGDMSVPFAMMKVVDGKFEEVVFDANEDDGMIYDSEA